MTKYHNLKKTSFDFKVTMDKFRISDDMDNLKIKKIINNIKENTSPENLYSKQRSKIFFNSNKSMDRKIFETKINFMKKNYITDDIFRYPISSIVLRKLPRIKIKKVELSSLAIKDNFRESTREKEKTSSVECFNNPNSPEENCFFEEEVINNINSSTKDYFNLKLNKTFNQRKKLKLVKKNESNNISMNNSNNNINPKIKSWVDKLEKIQSDHEKTINNSQKKYMENTLFIRNNYSIINAKEDEATKNRSYLQYSEVPVQKNRKILNYKVLRQEVLSKSEIGESKIEKILNRLNNIKTSHYMMLNTSLEKDNIKMSFLSKNNLPNII